jgi:hypothetical protein
MPRIGADQISGDPALQARLLRQAGLASMNAQDRDRMIMRLHSRGWKPARIAAAVDMTRHGVRLAIRRIREGGGPGRVRAE